MSKNTSAFALYAKECRLSNNNIVQSVTYVISDDIDENCTLVHIPLQLLISVGTRFDNRSEIQIVLATGMPLTLRCASENQARKLRTDIVVALQDYMFPSAQEK